MPIELPTTCPIGYSIEAETFNLTVLRDPQVANLSAIVEGNDLSVTTASALLGVRRVRLINQE